MQTELLYKNTSTISYLPCQKLSHGSQHIFQTPQQTSKATIPYLSPHPSSEFHTPWNSSCVHLHLPLWRNCLFITHHLWYPHYSQYSDWQALAHIHIYMWKWRGWSRVYAMQNVRHMNEEKVISPNENKGSVASIRRGECRSGKHSRSSSFISCQGHPIGTQ